MTPLALLSLAALAAGTGMQLAAAAQERRRMNQALNAELARQRQFQQEAQPIFQRSLEKTVDLSSLPALTQQRQQLYRASLVTPGEAVTTPTLSPSETEVFSLQNQAAARANLSAWQDWLANQGFSQLAANRWLSLIGDMAGQSAGVLPYEIQDASMSGTGLRTVGGLLSTLGTLGGVYNAVRPPGR